MKHLLLCVVMAAACAGTQPTRQVRTCYDFETYGIRVCDTFDRTYRAWTWPQEAMATVPSIAALAGANVTFTDPFTRVEIAMRVVTAGHAKHPADYVASMERSLHARGAVITKSGSDIEGIHTEYFAVGYRDGETSGRVMSWRLSGTNRIVQLSGEWPTAYDALMRHDIDLIARGVRAYPQE